MKVYEVEAFKYVAVLPGGRQALIFKSGPCGWRILELKREQVKYSAEKLKDKSLVNPPTEFIASRLSEMAGAAAAGAGARPKQ